MGGRGRGSGFKPHLHTLQLGDSVCHKSLSFPICKMGVLIGPPSQVVVKVNSVGWCVKCRLPGPCGGEGGPALGLEPQLPDCTVGLVTTPLTGSGGRVMSVKGLARRKRVLPPQCVIYVIIIVIYLAQGGHLLEAGRGHAQGSRGGLDHPLHVPPPSGR